MKNLIQGVSWIYGKNSRSHFLNYFRNILFIDYFLIWFVSLQRYRRQEIFNKHKLIDDKYISHFSNYNATASSDIPIHAEQKHGGSFSLSYTLQLNRSHLLEEMNELRTVVPIGKIEEDQVQGSIMTCDFFKLLWKPCWVTTLKWFSALSCINYIICLETDFHESHIFDRTYRYCGNFSWHFESVFIE